MLQYTEWSVHVVMNKISRNDGTRPSNMNLTYIVFQVSNESILRRQVHKYTPEVHTLRRKYTSSTSTSKGSCSRVHSSTSYCSHCVRFLVISSSFVTFWFPSLELIVMFTAVRGLNTRLRNETYFVLSVLFLAIAVTY